MKFKGQNILSTKQFDKVSMEELFRRAEEMEKILDGQKGWVNGKKISVADGPKSGMTDWQRMDHPGKSSKGFSKLLDGKILATLFFEPSTRTRFSFETAFLRLGGKVISGADMVSNSSVKKGETLYDTGKVVSQFADLIVMRHPEAGSVEELARGANPGERRTNPGECGASSGERGGVRDANLDGGSDAVVGRSFVPVINAGDGPNQHPTQALLDVYTIWKEKKGKLDGLVVGMVGDLKYGRVPHSQCDLLKHWKIEFVFVSPKALKMPWDVKDDLTLGKRKFFETEDLKEVIGDLDVILATRIQTERFKSAATAEKYSGVYIIDKKMMALAKKGALLMHPLPRVDEIAVEVDSDGRAKYFDQVRNGLVLRMALMAMVMGR